MHRAQNRSRNRDNYGGNNRNRSGDNDNRRRDDYSRNANRYQGGGSGRRSDMSNMSQMSMGSYGINTGGYNQNMGMYGGSQSQMGGYGNYGGSAGFQQQNRFGMGQQQMINPWASNLSPSSMGATGEEAKLAMNILNAVLSSSGPQTSGRGVSPPPNKMRRMDYRDGGYDDRRRRPRSPQSGPRSRQNRQQPSRRPGSDRRGRDGRSSSSSNQRNDDNKYRNSFSKSPAMSRSSKQSSDESTEFVFRKRLTYVEREQEIKKYKDLPASALKCGMCEKSAFHNVAAYLAHVDSKGHSKVSKAFHEKLAATESLLKQNARLVLHKALIKAKAAGQKFNERECRVCKGPMVYGSLKHKNILACKVMHNHHNGTYCCGKNHKSRSILEEHYLSLAHLKTVYESENHLEDKEEKETPEEEVVEDEEEKARRLKRDQARRKRKFGEDESEEDDDEEEEEEKNEGEHQNEKQEEENDKDCKEGKKLEEYKEQADTNEEGNENNKENEQMEVKEEKEDQTEEIEKEEEPMETNDVEKDTAGEDGKEIEEESNAKEEVKVEENIEDESKKTNREDWKNRDSNQKKDNKAKPKKDKDNKSQGKTIPQMTFQELLEFHKKSCLDDPENLGPYDPALPTGLNFIDMRVIYHCMACLDYCPAYTDDLKAHTCSKEHYDLFRCKYMKVKGVKDSPRSLRRLKNAQNGSKEETKDNEIETKDEGTEKDKDKEEEIKPTLENEDVGGDDALYDPYEGESGDLTAMLQEKKSPEGQKRAEDCSGYKARDEVHESEAENDEDNILDYEEDVGEDEEKYEGKEQKDKKLEDQKEDEDEEEEEEDVDDEEVEVEEEEEEVEGEEDEEEEAGVEEEEEEEGEGDEEEGGDDEEVEEEEIEEETGENQEMEENDEQVEEEEEEEASAQPPPPRRGRARRAF